MEKVELSILMPVYNAENYLKETIESIINQTFKNWELIIVNDGSNDNSGKICDDISKRDKRIKIIHKNNTGVSHTRNILLENAKGKYIGFVDSDDSIEKNMFEVLYNNIVKNNSDLVVCGFVEEKIEDNKIINKDIKKYYLKEVVDFKHMSSEFMSFANSEVLNPLWNKLYIRDIIINNNIRFLEDFKTGEDFIFNLDYLINIKTISFCNEVLYHYVKRTSNDSITYQYIDDMYNKGLEIHKILENFLKSMNFYSDNNKNILYGNHLMGIFYAMLNLFHKDCPMNYKQKKKYIKTILSSEYAKECANSRANDKVIVKIMALLIKINNIFCIFIIFKSISFIRDYKT